MAPTKTAEYSSLSNEELVEMLNEYGVTVGPINPFTRRTYERRLHKLATGQAAPPATPHDPAADDDEDADEEVQLKMPQMQKTPEVSPVPAQTRQRREVRETYDYSSIPRLDSRPPLSARKTTTTTTAYSTPRPAQTRSQPAAQSSQSSGGIPLWVKLLTASIVVVLVYLIWTNMEPGAVSNIPQVTDKVEV